jgi:cyclophilin family peptidyl-prolyl cis-trans isomerase
MSNKNTMILIGIVILFVLFGIIFSLNYNNDLKVSEDNLLKSQDEERELTEKENTNIIEEELEEDEIINTNEEEIIMTQATLKTSKGDIVLEFYPELAPNTVKNFQNLAEKGFYDGVIFHRVIEGFMIQGGDPDGIGTGGPGYKFDDELNPNSEIAKKGYLRGTLAMANSGPNTNGSQFFIMHRDYPLPYQYTIFGRVIEGIEVVDAIATTETGANDKPVEDIVINEVVVSTE